MSEKFKIQIKHRWDDRVLYESEHDNLKVALAAAFKSGADLREADLRGADLREADLRGADLRGACPRGADLRGVCLRGADLRGAKGFWQMHAVLAELLLRGAKDDVDRRKIAGLIAISTDWCWEQFLALDDPQKEWALNTLTEAAADDDLIVPDVIRTRMA